MPSQSAVTAVILAGGRGRRMGGCNKALLTLGGETIIQRQLREVSAITDDIIVVANDADFAERLSGAGVARVVPDRFAGAGPLAGAHAGFAAAAHPRIWLLGCDQPYASAAAVSLLLQRMDKARALAAIPRIAGKLQPLHAVYRREAGAVAETLLRTGERKMLIWLERLDRIDVEESELITFGLTPSFANDIDTPEQYERAIASWTATKGDRD
ncbi:molybdenum cofactor guanylyltransferase [Paenibacillaceae bacterium WGS1546]|uniref:molybdenum cofactor guanylyltransferase n=1 Tax=Cohnella sp. WGS1546 TaxID=3366810 RepID=UPI00372D71C4